MTNPFINTTLYTTIALHPSKLNNDIYINLKKELIRQLEGRCYKNYGYISKIYEILERDNGTIIPEDTLSAAVFKIKFSCRLCHPLENTQIICQMSQISNVFMTLRHDPIQIIVTNNPDRINNKLFILENNILKYKKTNETIEKGQFVKTTILGKTFTDKDKRILVIGTLDDIASDDDISKFYSSEYTKEQTFVDINSHMNHTTQPQQSDEINKNDIEKDGKEKKENLNEHNGEGDVKISEKEAKKTKGIKGGRVKKH